MASLPFNLNDEFSQEEGDVSEILAGTTPSATFLTPDVFALPNPESVTIAAELNNASTKAGRPRKLIIHRTRASAAKISSGAGSKVDTVASALMSLHTVAVLASAATPSSNSLGTGNTPALYKDWPEEMVNPPSLRRTVPPETSTTEVPFSYSHLLEHGEDHVFTDSRNHPTDSYPMDSQIPPMDNLSMVPPIDSFSDPLDAHPSPAVPLDAPPSPAVPKKTADKGGKRKARSKPAVPTTDVPKPAVPTTEVPPKTKKGAGILWSREGTQTALAL